MPVVIQPRVWVLVLPRQPDRLVEVVGVVFLDHLPPGIELRCPCNVSALVDEGIGGAQVVAQVVAHFGALVALFVLCLLQRLQLLQLFDCLAVGSLASAHQGLGGTQIAEHGSELVLHHAGWRLGNEGFHHIGRSLGAAPVTCHGHHASGHCALPLN